MMAKRRGNPHWGKAGSMATINGTSAFDSMVKSLGLSPEQYEDSTTLRNWVNKNKDHKYVPPELLQAWGLAVRSSNF